MIRGSFAALTAVVVLALGGCAAAEPEAPEPRPAAPRDTVPREDEVAELSMRERRSAPFAVQASGTPIPRPVRPEVAWVAPDTARGAARPDAAVVSEPDSVQRSAAGDSTRVGPASDTAVVRRAPIRRDTARAGARADTTARRPVVRPPTAAARPRSHTVVAGETFLGIARRFGVTAASLRAANPGVEWERLRTGTVLRIPSAPAGGAARPAAAATPPANRPATARPSTPRPAAPGARRTHVVKTGDTLFGLARRYGVSAAGIRSANGMSDDNVRLGQTLVIPPPD